MFIVIIAIVYFISSTFLCLDCIRINLRACTTKKNSGGGPPDPPHWRTYVRPRALPKHPHLAIPRYATVNSYRSTTNMCTELSVVVCDTPTNNRKNEKMKNNNYPEKKLTITRDLKITHPVRLRRFRLKFNGIGRRGFNQQKKVAKIRLKLVGVASFYWPRQIKRVQRRAYLLQKRSASYGGD